MKAASWLLTAEEAVGSRSDRPRKPGPHSLGREGVLEARRAPDSRTAKVRAEIAEEGLGNGSTYAGAPLAPAGQEKSHKSPFWPSRTCAHPFQPQAFTFFFVSAFLSDYLNLTNAFRSASNSSFQRSPLT